MVVGTQHPFRFGINVSGAVSRAEWIAKARKAEALGYDTLLMSDHLHNELAPVAALVAAAETTSTLRLGSFVFGNDFRHPVLLAQEAATIDLLSDGRLEFGIGTGYWHEDYEQSGITLDPPGVRINRLVEAVQIIKGLFGDAPLTYHGEHYTVRGLDGLPKPVQRPHPPIMIGGGGRRVLSFAAREADIVSVNIKTTAEGTFDFSSLTAEAAAQKVAWVREAAGERFDRLTLNILVPALAITESRRQTAEEMLRQSGISGNVMSVEQALESPSVLCGTVDEIVEDLQVRRERYGFSYIVVWEPMEKFAPVVERLAGK
jgi:probable F420-dependent oxidoreductase